MHIVRHNAPTNQSTAQKIGQTAYRPGSVTLFAATLIICSLSWLLNEVSANAGAVLAAVALFTLALGIRALVWNAK